MTALCRQQGCAEACLPSSQELEAAKAAADEQQRSQLEARQQLQLMLDERAAALDAAQQVPV